MSSYSTLKVWSLKLLQNFSDFISRILQEIDLSIEVDITPQCCTSNHFLIYFKILINNIGVEHIEHRNWIQHLALFLDYIWSVDTQRWVLKMFLKTSFHYCVQTSQLVLGHWWLLLAHSSMRKFLKKIPILLPLDHQLWPPKSQENGKIPMRHYMKHLGKSLPLEWGTFHWLS